MSFLWWRGRIWRSGFCKGGGYDVRVVSVFLII